MKELEDHPWFPAILRDFQTDYIGFLSSRWPGFLALVPWLDQAPRGASEQMDLCSGSGEPARTLFHLSERFVRLTLTDLFPRASFPPDALVRYEPAPVDARTIEPRSGACYTMFNAFHHFSDVEKTRLVYRLRAANAEAFLVEVLEPTPLCLAKVLLATTLGAVLLMPFVRPFSLARLFFTYLLPINVLTIAFDGVVSVFRSRSVERYRALFASDPGRISVHRLPGRLQALTVIHLARS